jgi:hypothetical protein
MFYRLGNNNQTEQGGLGEVGIGEGGCEGIIQYFVSAYLRTCRFTAPPAVAFLNY